MMIGVGSVKLSEQKLYEAEKIFPYPDYQPPEILHDIALIKLKKPVELSPTVQLIDFPYTKYADEKNVTALGWGQTVSRSKKKKNKFSRTSGFDPEKLFVFFYRVQPIRQCRHYYIWKNTPSIKQNAKDD